MLRPNLPVDVLVLKGFEEALQLVRRLGVVGLARASAESACVRHRGVWRRPLHELRHALSQRREAQVKLG